MHIFKYICFLLIVLFPSISMAAGFRIGEQGAAAMGRANAATASVDDVSAVYFNPAALTSLKKRWVFSAGGTLILPSSDYTNTDGVNSSKKSQIFTLPNLYIGKFLEEKNLAFGFGINVPFGLGTKWSDTGSFRYEATETAVTAINFNPTVAYRFGSTLSLGFGVDFQKLFVTYDKQNPWPVFGGSTDGKTHLSGESTGWGYNLGVLLTPSDKMKIGITYRSRVHHDIKGDVELTNINGALPLSVFGSSQYKTGASLPLDLPDVLGAGVSYKISDRLMVEFDLDWTGWSSYKQLSFDYAVEKAPFLTDKIIRKDWKDVLAYRAGFEYSYNDDLKLRWGYAYDTNPVPDSTFEPRITDSNRHQLTFGGGYRFGKFLIDAAYMAVFFEKRSISGSTIGSPYTDINGTYKSIVHLTGFNLTYIF